MPVTITADQAEAGDIIRDRDGNLWLREEGTTGQVFSLVFVFTHRYDDVIPPGADDVEADVLDLLAPLDLMMRDGQQVGDELPAPRPPRLVEFDYLLRDDLDTMERNAVISSQTGVPIVGELADKMMEHPFYEVTLRCQLDTVTGEVTILGVKN
jgi:hypothetical protein